MKKKSELCILVLVILNSGSIIVTSGRRISNESLRRTVLLVEIFCQIYYRLSRFTGVQLRLQANLIDLGTATLIGSSWG